MNVNCLSLILGTGKKPHSLGESYSVCSSDCYFDWFCISEINPDTDKKTIFTQDVEERNAHHQQNEDKRNAPEPCEKEINTLETYMKSFYRSYLDFRYRLSKDNADNHVQQGMFLFVNKSIDCDIKSIITASRLYISFISLSADATDGDIEQETIYVTLSKIISDSKISAKLYYSFDHCELVLLCDGTKTKLDDYITLIGKLRVRSIPNEDKKRICNDITSIYGYNLSRNPNNSSQNTYNYTDNEQLRIVMSISQKNPSIPLFGEKESMASLWQNVFETVGRYDKLLVSNPISWAEFSSVCSWLTSCSNQFFSRRIYLTSANDSVKIDGNATQSEVQNSEITKKLINYIDNKYNLYIKHGLYDKLLKADEDNLLRSHIISQLFNSLNEIYISIKVMLNRGFSRYYILSIFESFVQMIRYLDTGLFAEAFKIKAQNETDAQNKIDEKIKLFFRLINLYFGYIQTFTASTLHNERRFIQADPHQLSFLDVPPKLIAYYTAIANSIAYALKSSVNSNHIYSCIIIPDFNNDIYVETLVSDKNLDQHINILCIHVNEKSLYSVISTTKIIAHEIAHHTGLSSDLRKKRATYYAKTIIASILKEALDESIFCTDNINEAYSMFKKFIDIFFDAIDTDKFISELMPDKEYYTDVFISKYIKRINNYVYYDNSIFWDSIKEKLNSDDVKINVVKYFSNEICNSCDSTKKCAELDRSETRIYTKLAKKYEDNSSYNSFAKTHAINKIAFELRNSILDLQNSQDNVRKYVKTIKFLFQEGLADVQMSFLMCDPNPSSYFKLIRSLGYACIADNDLTKLSGNTDTVIRQLSVYKCLKNFSNNIENYDKLIAKIDDADEDSILYKLYRMYLVEQASEFFLNLPLVISYADKKNHNFHKYYERINDAFNSADAKPSAIVDAMNKQLSTYIDNIISL